MQMRKLKLLPILFSSLLVMCSITCVTANNAYADEGESAAPPHFRANGSGPDVNVEASKAAQKAKNLDGSNNIGPADDKNWLTAESSIPDEAKRYWDWAKCASVSIGSAPNDTRVSDEDCALPPELAMAGFTRDSGTVPTTREILLAASTLIHADGAGLHKRPDGVSYSNKHIPTLVAATHPTQTHVINLLGHDITITLTATSYTWSWGDGTPDLTTTSPGVPWHKGMKPNTDPALIRHYYTPPNGWRSRFDGPYPATTRTITLTTTWAGTATNPFTGETQTINGLVTTTETTGPFRLSHLLISNTDTWEESQGH
mgnify:CR=1 FL=1